MGNVIKVFSSGVTRTLSALISMHIRVITALCDIFFNVLRFFSASWVNVSRSYCLLFDVHVEFIPVFINSKYVENKLFFVTLSCNSPYETTKILSFVLASPLKPLPYSQIPTACGCNV